MLPLMLWQDGFPDPRLGATALGALLVLGVGCSALTYVLWNWGLQRVPASRAGVFVNVEPMVGATVGVVVLNEVLTAGTLVGGVLILGAALLTSGETTEAEAASQGALPVAEEVGVTSAE
jgi:drug/metabolite transporter (DMT)-like permease